MLQMILKEKGTSTFTPYSLPSSSQLNIREAISKFWLDCEQADIHLVKFEGILFSVVRASYCLVAIKNIVDEVRPFCRRQTTRPCYATNCAETAECHPRTEIPRVIFGRHALDTEPAALCHGGIL